MTRADDSSEDEQQKTTAEGDRVDQILRETTAAYPPGIAPFPDDLAVFLRRERRDYIDGTRIAIVVVPGDVLGDAERASRRFSVKYTEAFDHVLVPFERDAWARLRDAWPSGASHYGDDSDDGDGDASVRTDGGEVIA